MRGHKVNGSEEIAALRHLWPLRGFYGHNQANLPSFLGAKQFQFQFPSSCTWSVCKQYLSVCTRGLAT